MNSLKNLTIFTLFFISVFLVSSETFACSTIINENQAVNRSNTRNQDGLGWCYSYVASDLLSYRENKRISAIGFVKPGLYFDITRERRAGEAVSRAIDNTKVNNRLCLEKDLPSTDYFLTLKNRTGNGFLHQTLNEILATYDAIAASLEQAKKSGRDLTCVDQKSKNTIAKLFPTTTCLEILNAVKHSTKKQFLDKLLITSCNPVRTRPFSRKTYAEEDGWWLTPKKRLNDQIDRVLESKNIAGLTYNFAPVMNMEGRAMHASVVVGRKFNTRTRQCEYLIRNSHGRSCGASHPETRCDTSCNEDINKDCRRNNGYFWISERFLNHVGVNITVME